MKIDRAGARGRRLSQYEKDASHSVLFESAPRIARPETVPDQEMDVKE